MFFYPYKKPHRVFVEIVLYSKWTGVFLKDSRQKWQDTTPGEENDTLSIAETCATVNYSTLSAKSDTLSGSSSICNKCIT
jgi:hypothetical protein